MRPFLYSLVGLSLLSAACGEPATSPAEGLEPLSAPAQVSSTLGYVRQNFVYSENGEFKVNGQPLRHVGGNIPFLLYMPDEQVLQELDFMREAGMKQVRVFAPNNSTGGSAWGPTDVINRLRFVTNAAYARGIRVTVALTQSLSEVQNNGERITAWYADYNGREGRAAVWGDEYFYTRYIGNGLYMLNDSWVHWGYAQQGRPLGNFRDFAWALASNFKDDPGIFAWDISNEQNIEDKVNNVQYLVNFYVDMARLLKTADPNHMVTTGMISTGTQWTGMGDGHRDQIYNIPQVDYLTVHMYDDRNPSTGYGENDNSQRDDIWRANRRYNKPVVVEEFGMYDGPAGSGFDGSRDFYSRYFSTESADFQVDAIVHWGVTSNETGQSWGTGSTAHSPLSQGKIRPYQALWGRWAGQLDPYNTPLIVDNYGLNNDPNRTRLYVDNAVWTPSTFSGKRWGSGYQVATANAVGSSPVTFDFWLPQAGWKNVEGWWNGNSSRCANVEYRAYRDGGATLTGQNLSVNQQINDDRWAPVGYWYFTAGWNRVTLSNRGPVSGCYIIADALRIRN